MGPYAVRLSALAACAGFRVVAEDGEVGVVDTPLFPGAGATPDFLVVRTDGGRRPVVPVALVAGVDAAERVVSVRGARQEVAALPEHLPVAV